MPLLYDEKNWFWIVDGSETDVYSSAAGDFIPVADARFVAFAEAGGVATKITHDDMVAKRIIFLENQMTPRRLREAITGTDNGWLQNLNTQIATLRASLT